jgi:hypothetical protein
MPVGSEHKKFAQRQNLQNVNWPLVGATILLSGALAGGQSSQSATKPKVARSAHKSAKPKSKPKKAAVKSPIQAIPNTLELGPGETDMVEFRLSNPFGHPTIGSFKLNPASGVSVSEPGWDGPLPAWGTKFYTKVTANSDAMGDKTIGLTYFVDRAGDFNSGFTVRVKKPLDVEVTPDYDAGVVRIKVRNLLQNRTERGRVSLKNPERLLQDKVSALLPPIAPGDSEEVTVPVMTYGIAPGAAYHFDVTVETWAGYKATTSHDLVFYQGAKVLR